jgi:hypothetical protein
VRSEWRVKYGGRHIAEISKILAGQKNYIKAEHQLLVAKYPEAEAQLKQLFKIMCAIEVVAGHAPASVGGTF